jgi:hypothetical protein
MKDTHLFLPIFLAFATCGCFESKDQALKSPIHRYGLTEAKLYRPPVARGIQLANSLIQDDVGIKLAPGWEPATEEGAISVFLVREYNLSQQDMIFVPERERFIVANERQLVRFLDRMRVNDSNHSAIVALMLLHEVGHIIRGEWGSYEHNGDFEVTDLLGDDDPRRFSKNPELAADMFAATQVRKAVQDTKNVSRFVAGITVGSSITVHQFSIFGERLVDNFLKQSLEHFLDSGYTHPNYELRLLLISYLVHRDDGTRQLLTDFLNKRKIARARRPR